MKIKLNWDALGISASVICAIHCIVLPLVLTGLPLLGIKTIHSSFNSVFEWTMIGLAFFIGTYSLSHGYKKHHRSWTPILLFAVGFLFLSGKQLASSNRQHIILLLIAVFFIVTAHYRNYKLCNRNKCSDPHHSH